MRLRKPSRSNCGRLGGPGRLALGLSEGLLGGSWGPLGAILGLLGTILGRFGALLGSSWRQASSQQELILEWADT